jgi:hypothetical protein
MSFNVELLPSLIALSILSVVVLYTIIKLLRNWLVSFVLIPTTLIASIVIYQNVTDIMGYCIPTKIPNGAIYQDHVLSLNRAYIMVDVYLRDTAAERDKRCYAIPWSEENEEQMNAAEQKQGNGVMSEIQGVEGLEGQTPGGDYQIYDFQPVPESSAYKDGG